MRQQYRTGSQLKEIGKKKLKGRYGSAILINIVPALISMALLFIPLLIITFVLAFITVFSGSALSDLVIPAVVYPITWLCAVFEAMFRPGITLFYLNCACGRRTSIADILFGFRWQFKKSLSLACIRVFISVICLLPYNIFMFFLETDYQPGWLFCATASYIIGMAVQIPVTLMLSQVYYLLLDFPKYSTLQLLKTSIQIMKGHKGRLFFINLSFLPLILLGVFSIVGLLWVYPYMQITTALFYLDLMNPRSVSEA